MWTTHSGVVSFSARLVAGMRAYETKEKDALFEDPLAEVLAGERGMDGAKLTMKVRTTLPFSVACPPHSLVILVS